MPWCRERTGGTRRVVVQPVSLAYTRLHGVPMGREFRPFFAWYGDMDLVPHLWEAFCLGPMDVMVHYHPPMTVDQFPSRKELAAACERMVGEGVAHALAGRPGAVGPAYEDEPIELPPIRRRWFPAERCLSLPRPRPIRPAVFSHDHSR